MLIIINYNNLNNFLTEVINNKKNKGKYRKYLPTELIERLKSGKKIVYLCGITNGQKWEADLSRMTYDYLIQYFKTIKANNWIEIKELDHPNGLEVTLLNLNNIAPGNDLIPPFSLSNVVKIGAKTGKELHDCLVKIFNRTNDMMAANNNTFAYTDFATPLENYGRFEVKIGDRRFVWLRKDRKETIADEIDTKIKDVLGT